MPSCLIHEIYASIPECEGHIALSQVFGQVVAIECDIDPLDHTGLREQLSTPSSSLELLRWFTRNLQSGRLNALGRPIGGGSPKPMPRDHWHADVLAERFISSRYCRSKPFDADAHADTWIFIPEDEFEALWIDMQERVIGQGPPRVSPRRSSPVRDAQADLGDRQLLSVQAVEVIVGLGRSSIYKLMKEDAFPAQVKIGGRALWRRQDIDRWVHQLP